MTVASSSVTSVVRVSFTVGPEMLTAVTALVVPLTVTVKAPLAGAVVFRFSS